MEGERRFQIVSKQELMPTILLQIVKTALDSFSLTDSKRGFEEVFCSSTKLLYAILKKDIDRLEPKDKIKYELPKQSDTTNTKEYYLLFTELWSLARDLGHTGTEEKTRDFESLINMIREGIINE
jgi:hypothetical protein